MDMLTKYPVLDERVMIYLTPAGTFVYNLDYKGTSVRKKKIELNKSGEDLLLNFNGNESLENIIRKLTDSEESFRLSLPLVLDFLMKISEFIPIKFYDRKTPTEIRIKGNKNRWIPMHVSLELTNKCNLICRYCYNESSPDKKDFLIQPIKVLQKLYELGTELIELTGGEPLLHPEICKILSFACQKFSLTALLTNGCLINEEIIEILKEYRNKCIVQVSLHGSTPEKAEKTNGVRKAFFKIIKAIENLSKEGIVVRVGMVIDTLEKIDDIENTLILAKNLGATYFQVSTALPLGRANGLEIKFIEKNISKLEYILISLYQKYYPFFTSKVELEMEEFGINESHNCGAGYKSVTIGPEGRIRVCSLSAGDFCTIGKVNYSSDKDLIRLSAQKTNLFSKLEAPNKKICNNCKEISYCSKCIVRGLSKSKEIGEENCNWIKKNLEIIKKIYNTLD